MWQRNIPVILNIKDIQDMAGGCKVILSVIGIGGGVEVWGRGQFSLKMTNNYTTILYYITIILSVYTFINSVSGNQIQVALGI